MTINLSFDYRKWDQLSGWLARQDWLKILILVAISLSVVSTWYSWKNDYIVAYGDAESHLNIAKRVVHSLTPGFAQLGGIWLPLPHLLMVPLVWFDPLWRSGLGGSIISGAAYVVTSIYLYKLTWRITKNKLAAVVAFAVFALNPSVLYMQSTPMTELPLIAFFILSNYFFIKFLENDDDIVSLIVAAFFGFCASLSRYDGWFLVLGEAGSLVLVYGIKRELWKKLEGRLILFSTLAMFGILLWIIWDWLILGDPFYFSNSPFSAKSQQSAWLARGELPGHQSLVWSTLYYLITSLSNIGVMVFGLFIVGLVDYLKNRNEYRRWIVSLVLMIPFIFYVVTQFIGQSVIFIPHLTPTSFEWTLFNVRYGLMMVPTAAFFVAYLFHKRGWAGRAVMIGLLVVQIGLYAVGYSRNITLADGTVGLSSAKRPHAESWIKENYDEGLVLVDDYARTVSVVRSGIPMQNMISIGNKPYWEESLKTPEKYATWIITQRGDTVWHNVYEPVHMQARLYAHFQKVYTSDEILIFRKPK